jgi:predicted HicB family RNase H-like nuclease
MLTYKNYIAQVQFDGEAEILYGEVINTRDVITFQGKTPAAVKQAFKDSIDDYLAFCAARNETPDKPFSGKFNLRLSPALHQETFIAAKHEGMSLNNLVTKAINNYLHEQCA